MALCYFKLHVLKTQDNSSRIIQPVHRLDDLPLQWQSFFTSYAIQASNSKICVHSIFKGVLCGLYGHTWPLHKLMALWKRILFDCIWRKIIIFQHILVPFIKSNIKLRRCLFISPCFIFVNKPFFSHKIPN